MSAFHYKAELVAADLPKLRYRFFPKAFEQESESGVFEVATDSWKIEILEPIDATNDLTTVLALVHKLKKHLAENCDPPREIWHIA